MEKENDNTETVQLTVDSEDIKTDENTDNELNGKHETKEFKLIDNPMHVDFNENEWIPGIPHFSLTTATLVAALIAITVGLAVNLTRPSGKIETVTNQTINSTTEIYNSSIDYISEYGEYGQITKEQDGNDTYITYYIQYNVTATTELPADTIADEWISIIGFPGKLWVNALKLLVLPLLIFMMLILPSRVDEIGFIGKRAVPLYLFTSTCAAIQGTIWAYIIKPGTHGETTSNLSTPDVEPSELSELDAFLNIFYNAVPSNIISAMSSLSILGVLLFFICMGVLLKRPSVREEERRVILSCSKGFLRCCMMAVVWVVWCTPIGMMSLIMVKIITTENLAHLGTGLGFYLLTVVVGHTVHVFGFYPATFFVTTRGNGWRYFSKIYPAPMVAFATSSSAATLPRSLEIAEKNKLSSEVYEFVLPLGAAINMDGTALGFPVMIAFISQLYGIELDIGSIITVLLLSVVISVGTAPIPNVGLVYLTMLFEAAGIGYLAGEGLAILFILDWLVDRIETAVNVTSDLFVAKIMDVISQKSKKKEIDIVCGCCVGSMYCPGSKKKKNKKGENDKKDIEENKNNTYKKVNTELEEE